jgi:hypothetical protein
MRMAIRLAIAAIGAGALVVGILAFAIDAVAKRAVERSLSRALGVAIHVDSLSLGFVRGGGRIGGVQVDNPPGFSSRPFLSLERGHVQTTLGSLRDDTVRVGTFTLDGVDLMLESTQARANYGAILENLDQLETASGPGPGPVQTFSIGELVIRDLIVRVEGDLETPDARSVVAIPEVVVNDIAGVDLPRLAGVVVEAILQAAGREGEGLPESLRQALQAALERVNEIEVADSRAVPPEPALGRDVTSVFDDLPGVSLPGLPRRTP